MNISTSSEDVDHVYFKKENGTILDYRDKFNPLNELLISCEHASNDLPENYTWT